MPSPEALAVEIEREENGRWIAEVPAIPGVLAYSLRISERQPSALDYNPIICHCLATTCVGEVSHAGLPHPRPGRGLAPNGAAAFRPYHPRGQGPPARNGTRHGLRGATFTLLPDEDPAEWAAHLDGYLARLRPADAAELACVERLAACDWREARLLRLEAETLFAARGDTSEPDPRLGWSRTLPRYAAAIRRDRKEALEQLEMLRAARPRLPAQPTVADAARFRWLAERIERAVAEGPVTPANRHARTRGAARGGRRACPETPATAAAHASPNRVTPDPGRSARSTAPSAAGSRPWPGGRREPRPQAARAGAASPRGRGPGRRGGASAGAGAPTTDAGGLEPGEAGGERRSQRRPGRRRARRARPGGVAVSARASPIRRFRPSASGLPSWPSRVA